MPKKKAVDQTVSVIQRPRKKAVTKKAEKKTVKKETVKKETVKKVPLGATGRVCELLVQRAYTDQEIIDTIMKEFPERTEKQIKVYISVQRADINAGRKKQFVVDTPLVRLVEKDGELVPYTPKERVKKSKTKLNDKQKSLVADYINEDEDEAEE